MRDDDGMVVSADWGLDQTRNKRLRLLSGLGGIVALGALSLPAMSIGERVAHGVGGYFLSAGVLILFAIPLVLVLVFTTEKEQRKTDEKVKALADDLAEAVRTADREASKRDVQARRQRFESRLANALDMAEGEPEVIDVIERSFAAVLSDSPVELLLADNSHAHLQRMAGVSPTGEPCGCGVDSPDHCPAARRAQVQVFDDSDNLDACPKLRDRPNGRLSALCVPVSIMGRTVGVIHATGKPNVSFVDDKVQDLETLAKLAGARIGLLRVMAETQLQASTDSLTGLLNRRSFEARVSATRRDESTLAVAMADLDHFKTLNDTYGHETGDRALRLFSQVLRESLRSHDLMCRHGGEEFAIAFPACKATQANIALDAVRSRLDAAIITSGLPKFTASFGVTDAHEHEDLPSTLGRADNALLEAKLHGRDRVVVYNQGDLLVPSDSPDPAVESSTPTMALADQFRREFR
jgi:diguanylate cyclase (GGDEF)-like protein